MPISRYSLCGAGATVGSLFVTVEPGTLTGESVRLDSLSFNHVDTLCAFGLDDELGRFMVHQVRDRTGMEQPARFSRDATSTHGRAPISHLAEAFRRVRDARRAGRPSRWRIGPLASGCRSPSALVAGRPCRVAGVMHDPTPKSRQYIDVAHVKSSRAKGIALAPVGLRNPGNGTRGATHGRSAQRRRSTDGRSSGGLGSARSGRSGGPRTSQRAGPPYGARPPGRPGSSHYRRTSPERPPTDARAVTSVGHPRYGMMGAKPSSKLGEGFHLVPIGRPGPA